MIDIYYVGKINPQIKEIMKRYKVCRLLSYVLDKKEIIKSLDGSIPLFMDSGAYSAYTKGKIIDIDEYINFINQYGENIRLIASLDVINEPIKSYENYDYIYNKIKYKDKLVPCFHLGEPLEYLDKYLSDARVSYIAIGGLAINKKNQNKETINGIVNYIRGKNKNIKIHLFGITNIDLISDVEITSVDSSTWIRRAIYGDILNPINGKAYHLGNKNKLKIEEYSELINKESKDILESLHLNFEDLKNSAENRSLFNLIAFEEYLLRSYNKTKNMIKKSLF